MQLLYVCTQLFDCNIGIAVAVAIAVAVKSEVLYRPDLRALKRHTYAKGGGRSFLHMVLGYSLRFSFLVFFSTSSYVISTRANLCQDEIDAN